MPEGRHERSYDGDQRMTDARVEYPDNSGIHARKAEGRRQQAALGFVEKLAILDELRARVAPIVRAREARKLLDTRKA